MDYSTLNPKRLKFSYGNQILDIESGKSSFSFYKKEEFIPLERFLKGKYSTSMDMNKILKRNLSKIFHLRVQTALAYI